jgi:hypothetical protein
MSSTAIPAPSIPPPPKPLRGQRLSSLLTSARSVPDLCAAVAAHAASPWESSQHAIVCVLAARFGGADAASLFSTHAARWLACGAGGSGQPQDSLHRARQAANILHAAAKLAPQRKGGNDGAVVARLVEESGARAPSLTAQGAATCLWSLERLLRHGDAGANAGALSAVLGAAVREAPHFSAVDTVMGLSAVARLLSGAGRGAPAGALPALQAAFPPLLAAAAREAPRFDARQAAACAWAAARAEQDAVARRDGGVRGSLAPLFSAAARGASDFSPAEAANCLWAAAKLQWEDGAHVGALARVAVREAPWSSARDAALCLWSAATLGLRDGETVAGLLGAALRHAERLSPGDASRALWAAVELRAGTPAQLEPLVKAFRRARDAGALNRVELATAEASFGKLRGSKYAADWGLAS